MAEPSATLVDVTMEKRENILPFGSSSNEGEQGAATTAAEGLFTFLKELAELRTKTVRSLDEYKDVLWLSDVPRNQDFCDCVLWRKEEEENRPEVWMEIRQPRLTPHPNPSPDLDPWLRIEQIEDSSGEWPELQPETVDWESDGERTSKKLEDHPEVQQLWESYILEEWEPWAERDKKLQLVQSFYSRVFDAYQKQQRLGEQYEIVLGLGVLAWRDPQKHELLRHLVTRPASIVLESKRGVLRVEPAAENSGMAFELDMLDPKDRPEPEELKDLQERVGRLGEAQAWSSTGLEEVLSSWVHSVSPKGSFSASSRRPPELKVDPRINLAPAVILRRRTDRSYIRAFDEIVNLLKERVPVPPGVLQFLGRGNDNDKGEVPLSPSTATGGEEEEIFFPLLSNDEQSEIVEKLASNYGVLVQGPPGTGKSHTIVNLISHLLATGQRVLVTSHKPNALRVLRSYIQDKVPEISPLTVVVLGNDRDSLQSMEDSVQGITDRKNRWSRSDYEKRVATRHAELDAGRRERALALEELRSLREAEAHVHQAKFGGYSGKLAQIAARVREEAEGFQWLSDIPEEDQEAPFSQEAFAELLELLRDPQLDGAQATEESLDPSVLLSPDEFRNVVSRWNGARERFAATESARKYPGWPPVEARPGLASSLAERLRELSRRRAKVVGHSQPWTEQAVSDVLGDRAGRWRELLRGTIASLGSIESAEDLVEYDSVSGLADRDRRVVRADAEALLAHLASGGGLGVGPFRRKPVRQGRYLLEQVRVEGRLCGTAQDLGALVSWLEADEELRRLEQQWAGLAEPTTKGFASRAAEFRDFVAPLEEALALQETRGRAAEVVQQIEGLSEPAWHIPSDVESLSQAAQAVRASIEFHVAEDDLRSYESSVLELKKSPAIRELLTAVRTKDPDGYAVRYDALVRLRHRSLLATKRARLLEELEASAQELASLLQKTPDDVKWDERKECFAAAWDHARAKAWIRRMSRPGAEKELAQRYDQADERVRRRLGRLAAERAWAFCFDQMDDGHRAALVAWSKAMSKVGKGYGKHAPQHRRDARKHMADCRSAIPAWIMPLYKVAETIRPGQDLFDVAIIDEASQSGIEALLLTYVAKKIVVVGDDKQIAPETWIDRQDVNQLRSRYIPNLPQGDQYGVDSSYFDIAEIRYPASVRLREHFRCMPEIIQFSNSLSYGQEPLIPLRQYGSSRIQPVVAAEFVQDGYQRGSGQSTTNPPEASAVVRRVQDICADPAYAEKTIGVICLLGHGQARLVERKLLEAIGPEQMQARQIVCGDPYSFQGDERHVILLSLVVAREGGNRIRAQTGAKDMRRFNVAASRAQDQMILFHSVALDDLRPSCLRHRLLDYCLNPRVANEDTVETDLELLRQRGSTVNRSTTPLPDPFDSWFEVDVFLRIADKGFKVVPQYEMAGKRIDLMVFGMEGRLAVECYGEYWHEDRYDEDTARQRKLERCGLQFVSIRYSVFELDPEEALTELWAALNRRGIHPSLVGTGEADEGGVMDLGLDSEEVARPVPFSSGFRLRKQPN